MKLIFAKSCAPYRRTLANPLRTDVERSGRHRLARRATRFAGAMLFALLVACGTPSSPGSGDDQDVPAPPPVQPPAQGVVGPDGGTVASEDGSAILEVPAGALDAEVTVSVAPDPATSHPWAAAGTAFLFEPEGLEFKQPARLSIRYDPDGVTATDPERGLALHRIDGDDWTELESSVDASSTVVSADISGFSRYAIAGVAPRLTVNVGVMHPTTLVPLARAEVRGNACIAGACNDIEDESEDYPTGLIPVFLTSEDGCDFRVGQFAGFLQDFFPTEASGDSGSAFVDFTASERGSRAWFDYELNSFAVPVYRPGHNTTGTVVSTLSFLSLNSFAPGERRLVVDIDNPGGVTYDLAVAWLLEGGAAGVFSPHVQASSEIVLLRCGQAWSQGEHTTLFSTVASPLPPLPGGSEDDENSDETARVEEAGVMRLGGLSATHKQLWVGLHVQTRARSAHGDDEGTIGYGLIDGGQATATGSFAVIAEPPEQ